MKNIFIVIIGLFLNAGMLQAQTDTMYIMKGGVVINKQSIKLADVDSVIFYKPVITSQSLSISTALIPAGTFTMGSPETEAERHSNETQHSVTLSAFRMSKYEITNEQYAAFLNAKNIGGDGLYAAGAYPTKTLISASWDGFDWGLHYSGSQWIPITGYESSPVICVTWYGATEYASYVGGTLPTEAQWEYACRAGTTTTFNTGNFLTNLQANYGWDIFTGKTQTVGSYSANAYELYDMHGNVREWCSDWDNGTTYSSAPQTNPIGPATGSGHIVRGGGWEDYADHCRSAERNSSSAEYYSVDLGFRVVFLP